MTDHNALRVAALVQLAQTQPKVRELLERVEVDLPPYGELAPGVPGMEVWGNLKDAVDRVSYDPQAQNDLLYSTTMFAAVLAEVATAQQERIEALERALSVEAKS